MYLNSLSHHHPAQKLSNMSTLVHRAKCISDADHLADEIEVLKTLFLKNGSCKTEMECVIAKYEKKKPQNSYSEEDMIRGIVVIPYIVAQ